MKMVVSQRSLELRAVKTSLVWRIKELHEGPVRFVHLVD